MAYILDFLLFLAKTVVILGGIGMVISIIVSSGSKAKKFNKNGHLKVFSLNKHYEDLKKVLNEELLTDTELKQEKKQFKKEEKQRRKLEKIEHKSESSIVHKPSVFVLDFLGDIRASAVKSLREEVTAILSLANPEHDEVFVRLETGGGMVPGYGLAASQLKRIVDKKIRLTIAVDKIAASGGYMMACVAKHIIASPFAVLGSIGVVAQLPNIHKLLKKHDIDVELHTAGEYKRTLTVFGENTNKGREKFKQEIEDIHLLFKDFVKDSRGSRMDMEKVATGEIWYGTTALKLGLVDEIKTSDEYLYDMSDSYRLLHIAYEQKKSVVERLSHTFESALETSIVKIWGQLGQRFFS